MSRRTKRRTVSPEVEAAHITARATEASAMITASATVASAAISASATRDAAQSTASATRSAAHITGRFALMATGLAGAFALASGTVTPPSTPPGSAEGDGSKYRGADSQAAQVELLLDQKEREAVMMQAGFKAILEADCTRYDNHGKRMACIDKKAAARSAVRASQQQVSAIRIHLGIG